MSWVKVIVIVVVVVVWCRESITRRRWRRSVGRRRRILSILSRINSINNSINIAARRMSRIDSGSASNSGIETSPASSSPSIRGSLCSIPPKTVKMKKIMKKMR